MEAQKAAGRTVTRWPLANVMLGLADAAIRKFVCFDAASEKIALPTQEKAVPQYKLLHFFWQGINLNYKCL